MKCDRCDNEATVQEITIRDGARFESRLCEQCARQAGLAKQSNMPLSELLTKYVLATGIASPNVVPNPRQATDCPSCKMTWAEFRQVDRLGCPDCYAAFEAQLGPLLERAHEGGVRHSGKVPARASLRPASPAVAQAQLNAQLKAQGHVQGHPASAVPPPGASQAQSQAKQEAADRALRVAALKKQLDQAVAAEQYERAAALRDQIRRLTEPPAPPSSAV